MPNARGTLFLNSIAFVRERFGAEACERVVLALPAAARASFDTAPREASWHPVDHLVAYMAKARELLAPDDASFHREMGRFSGLRDRRERAFAALFADVAVGARMAGVIWRAYFDAGRMEPLRSADGFALRIHDFPARRELCERILGSLEGQWAEFEPTVTKTACRLDGKPYCEVQVRFPARPNDPR